MDFRLETRALMWNVTRSFESSSFFLNGPKNIQDESLQTRIHLATKGESFLLDGPGRWIKSVKNILAHLPTFPYCIYNTYLFLGTSYNQPANE